jgi:cation transport ATPase
LIQRKGRPYKCQVREALSVVDEHVPAFKLDLLLLSLAAIGFLPLVIAAAAQSIPDLGILANSSRLLGQK